MNDDNFDLLAEQTQAEYLHDEEIAELREHGFEVQWAGTDRICSDCDQKLAYHRWITVRCTLDDEDVTKHYCFECYLQRMRCYVRRLKHVKIKPVSNGRA